MLKRFLSLMLCLLLLFSLVPAAVFAAGDDEEDDGWPVDNQGPQAVAERIDYNGKTYAVAFGWRNSAGILGLHITGQGPATSYNKTDDTSYDEYLDSFITVGEWKGGDDFVETEDIEIVRVERYRLSWIARGRKAFSLVPGEEQVLTLEDPEGTDALVYYSTAYAGTFRWIADVVIRYDGVTRTVTVSVPISTSGPDFGIEDYEAPPEPVRPDPVEEPEENAAPEESTVPEETAPEEEQPAETVPVAAAERFSDVKESDWFAGAVDYALQKGFIAGTSDTTFSPQQPLTRGMLVAMLYGIEGAPETEMATAFTDVAANAWYAKAVAWASANGVSAGYGDRFGANDNVTREQLVVMLRGYCKLKGIDLVEGEDLSSYEDAGEISSWAAEALAWAKAAGLIGGRTAVTIAPRGSATRAEAAMILMNFLEKVVGE